MSSRPLRSRFFAIFLVLLLSGLAAGCGSRSEEPAEPTPASSEEVNADSTPPALAGSAWLVKALGEGSDQVTSLPSVQSTLGFLVDRYGGNGGCNYYVGTYSVDGESLLMESPARTGAACAEAPESLTQENVLMSALATTARYAINDGNLELYAANDQLMLTLSPIEPAPLQGTTWTLQFVNAETQWEEVLPGSEISLRVENGELTGSTGCNEYAGTVSEAAGAISISDLTFTEMACAEPEGVMDQEALYLSLLEEAALVRQFPASLEMLDADGEPLLMFGTSVEAAD